MGADVDLTSVSGPTGGYMARAIIAGNTGGNLAYYDMSGAGPYVVAMAANQRLDTAVSGIVNATTTIATVNAVL